MVKAIANEFLTDERDRKYYADNYSCCPPPLFIIFITLVEVGHLTLPSISKCFFLSNPHLILLGFTGFYRFFLLAFTGFDRVWLGLTGFYWVLMGFTGFYQVLPGLTGFEWVLLDFTRFYRVLPDFSVFDWVWMGLSGFD